MEASKTIRHQIGPNGESGKKMEWVTPKISLMGAVDTHSKIPAPSEKTTTLTWGGLMRLGS